MNKFDVEVALAEAYKIAKDGSDTLMMLQIAQTYMQYERDQKINK